MIRILNRNVSVRVTDRQADLTIAFGWRSHIGTPEKLKALLSIPTFDEILQEATRLKQARGVSNSNDQEIEAKALRYAQRRLFRSPDRGLHGVPKSILQEVIDGRIELFRLRPENASEVDPLDHEVRIDFGAIQSMLRHEQDRLPLADGATLFKLATLEGAEGFGTFGYYKPAKGLIIFNADIGRMVADALQNKQAASPPPTPHPQPERHAPRAERPPVERPARGSNRPRNS